MLNGEVKVILLPLTDAISLISLVGLRTREPCLGYRGPPARMIQDHWIFDQAASILILLHRDACSWNTGRPAKS